MVHSLAPFLRGFFGPGVGFGQKDFRSGGLRGYGVNPHLTGPRDSKCVDSATRPGRDSRKVQSRAIG